jgi:hypothetical protein
VTFEGSSIRSSLLITRKTRATLLVPNFSIKSLLHEANVCSPPSNPGTSKNLYEVEIVPKILVSFEETYVVTAIFDFFASKSLPFGLPDIRVFRIEDFPFPANPITTMDFLKLALVLSMICVAVQFLNNIIEFLYYRVLIINRYNLKKERYSHHGCRSSIRS